MRLKHWMIMMAVCYAALFSSAPFYALASPSGKEMVWAIWTFAGTSEPDVNQLTKMCKKQGGPRATLISYPPEILLFYAQPTLIIVHICERVKTVAKKLQA